MDIKRPGKVVKKSELTPKPPTVSALDLELPAPSLALPRKKSRRFMWLMLITAIFIVITTVSSIWAFVWYNDALGPRSNDTVAVSVQVQSGASVSQVADELQQKGVIKSSLAFTIYMKLNNKSIIKTGTYFFAPDQSVSEIVDWLNQGRVGTRKVTILPGKTIVQIRQELIDAGFTADDVDAALAKHYTRALLADKPATANLEGYIFPDTYFVTSDSTADQLLVRTFDDFEKQIDADNLRAGLAARGFTLYQGITLASIITKEVTTVSDQKQVAQVFESRLATGMVLGSDVTYQYAAKLLGVPPSSDIDSPYNTRKYPGLPPGPIANFNISVLEAVANPSAGSYLYFVAGDDGTTHYATTFAQHQQNVTQYCHKLCSVQ